MEDVHKTQVIIKHSFYICWSFKVVENLVPEQELEIRVLGKKENEKANFGSRKKKWHRGERRGIFHKITETIESMRNANERSEFLKKENKAT